LVSRFNDQGKKRKTRSAMKGLYNTLKRRTQNEQKNLIGGKVEEY
jgi:hypothetical protein